MTIYKFIDIIEIFKSKKCEILTLEKDYVPLMTLDYKCECGNISKVKLKNFKLRTNGCKKCFNKNNNEEYIKKEFENKNCKLLSTEYTNAFQRLDYICSCNNKATIRYNDLQNGYKCRKCKLERTIATNIEKYGCGNPMQNLEIFNKSNNNAKKWKIYKFNNGKEVKVQGYENLALSLLENKYEINQDDIITQFDNEIYYTFIKNYHKYFPDIYIKTLNKIIEVKSDYVYKKELQKNIMKKKACLYLGYKFEFWIFDGKHNLTII
jgi:hypothetical protein